MTDMHAAIGRVQLKKLPGWTADRQRERRVPERAPRRRHRAADEARCGARVPPVHDPDRRPRPGPRSQRRSKRAGSAAASTTRPRSTGCRASGWTSTCPSPRPPRSRCCRCPCTRRSPRMSSSTIVEAVNAVAKAGSDDAARRPRSASVSWGATTRGCSPWSTVSSSSASPTRRPTSPSRSRASPVVHDLADLIALGIDYAVVAAPTMYHLEIGRQLAEAGVHALIEKPVASTAEESRAALRPVRRPGAGRGRRPHRAVQPGPAGRAPAHRGRRARRDLPDRDPAPGPVPGPDRRRRRHQGPRHARHRPHRLGQPAGLSSRSTRAPRTAAAARTRTWCSRSARSAAARSPRTS